MKDLYAVSTKDSRFTSANFFGKPAWVDIDRIRQITTELRNMYRIKGNFYEVSDIDFAHGKVCLTFEAYEPAPDHPSGYRVGKKCEWYNVDAVYFRTEDLPGSGQTKYTHVESTSMTRLINDMNIHSFDGWVLHGDILISKNSEFYAVMKKVC